MPYKHSSIASIRCGLEKSGSSSKVLMRLHLIATMCGSPAHVCFLLRQRLWVQLYQRWEGLLQLFNEAARASVVITPVREIAARPAPLPSSLRLRIPRRRLPEHPPQPVAVLVSAQFVLACRCMPSQLALTLDTWPTRPRQLWKVTRNSEYNVRK